MVFGVCLGSVSLRTRIPISALPPLLLFELAQKLFRGEPAISQFDWNFTSCHNSSPCVERQVGSVLHQLLHWLQPGHGKLTGFRVCYVLSIFRAIHPRFHYASVLIGLRQTADSNSLAHSSI